jgi:hypothetical protein
VGTSGEASRSAAALPARDPAGKGLETRAHYRAEDQRVDRLPCTRKIAPGQDCRRAGALAATAWTAAVPPSVSGGCC